MRTSWARSLVAATATVVALAAVIAAGRVQYVPDLGSESDAKAGSGDADAADKTTTTTAPPVTVPETGAATGVGSTTTTTTTEREPSTTEQFIEGVGRLRDSDAADPFVVMEGQQMWLFTTNNQAGNVPVLNSIGGGIGRPTTSDALPTLPAWATEGNTWAPAVTRTDDGWVLAFTARHTESSRQCIGVATADTVSGPYTAQPEPLVCDTDRGGSIDPSFVSDDAGHLWLLYKDDGNCCGLPTSINAVALTSNATALAGSPVTLIGADLAWEGGLIEAPTMTQVGHRWLLLYSANRWETGDYTMGAAWCDSPTGPCEKQAEPVLPTRSGIEGSGGVEFASGVRAGTQLVTFHAWPEGQVGDASAQRRLQVGRATYDPTTDTVTVTAFTPRVKKAKRSSSPTSTTPYPPKPTNRKATLAAKAASPAAVPPASRHQRVVGPKAARVPTESFMAVPPWPVPSVGGRRSRSATKRTSAATRFAITSTDSSAARPASGATKRSPASAPEVRPRPTANTARPCAC